MHKARVSGSGYERRLDVPSSPQQSSFQWQETLMRKRTYSTIWLRGLPPRTLAGCALSDAHLGLRQAATVRVSSPRRRRSEGDRRRLLQIIVGMRTPTSRRTSQRPNTGVAPHRRHFGAAGPTAERRSRVSTHMTPRRSPITYGSTTKITTQVNGDVHGMSKGARHADLMQLSPYVA